MARRIPRKTAIIAVAILLGVVATAVTFLLSRSGARRRVIIITLDTTRADHLGCYGHAQAHTPNLDRLAREGALFSDVSSSSPTTLPAHASIFTGRFPPSHGARNNGNYILVDRETTLAEVLREQGLRTAAFVAADVLSKRYGLAQGFETYDDDLLSGGIQPKGVYRQLTGEKVIAKAIAWLESRRSQEFFLWIHLFDPHAPYLQHAEHPAADPYDSEIAFMDACIGTLITQLEHWGLLDETIIVAIADHGESLGEHGEDTHGVFVYQSTLRVPLLIRAPGLVAAGTHIDSAVRSIDLMPTVLELLDLPVPAGVTGRSLGGYLRGEPEGAPRRAYFETFLPRIEFLWSSLAGMRVGSEKYIAAPTPELYDLASDPGEEHNLLAGASSDLDTRWKDRLKELRAALPAHSPAAEVAAGAEERASMRALGYGFAPIQVKADLDLPDPKAGIHNNHHYRLIQDAWRAEDYQRVVALSRAGAQAAPMDLYQACFHARALTRLKLYDRAEKLFQRLLDRIPDDPLCTRSLALIYAETNRLELAERSYRHAIELEPMQALSYSGLGDVLMKRGDSQGAGKAWSRAIELKPYFPKVGNNLGILAAQQGRMDDAIHWFERVLAIDPSYGKALQNLARTASELERQRRWLALLELSRKRLQRAPTDPTWMLYRAIAALGLGDRASAFADLAHLRARSDLSPALRRKLAGLPGN